jgi:putative nucleotide binding protein
LPEGRPPKKEEIARILDYLPYGRSPDSRSYQKQPVVQGVGEANFVLIEMTPKEGVVPHVGDKVYIGSGERDVIDHVNRRIDFQELSNSAKLELPFEIQRIILASESRFIQFFNDAGPLTTRMHALELLPGIGKKLMWAILNERKKGAFNGFKDLTDRVKGLHYPEKLIGKRIEDELMDDRIKYRIFTTEPRRLPESRRR